MSYIHMKTGCFATGTVGKDAEFLEVGEKKTPKLTFSLAVGKGEDKSTIWFNCQAWRKIAEYGQGLNISKGDNVTVFGKWESNEYNGKTYHNLIVEWISKMIIGEISKSTSYPDFAEIVDEVNDEDLPF